ncbi:MAG: type II toxin-antitoxin system VapC family toxin [Bacteroidales bacterium]|jgi:predicted nucleic acid-binding protein|nr:type II toxin-antitoxin system VapC family toxin [Bacteroidales bacterium]
MILCDTNVFIEIFRNRFEIEAIIKFIGHENIVISDVVKSELLFGAKDKKELQSIKNLLNNYRTLSIQHEISRMAADLVEQYCLSHKLNIPDSLIAATALYHNVELFTLNIKDFRFIPNLKLYQI